MSLAISLEWDYCPDGVEIHDYEEGLPGASLATARRGLWVRPKTRAVRKRRLELRKDLSGATVLKFANADDDQALVAFMSEYGMLGSAMPESGVDELPLGDVMAKRDRLKLLLETKSPAREFNRIELPSVTVVLQPKPGARPTIGLQPKSLFGFMCLEAAMLITGDSEIRTCENCGTLFTVGPASGKRAGSIYCSSRCRVAAHRARLG